MSAQIVFLTLFLGLTSGLQRVDLHVDGPVKSVRILSGDRELARLTAPPWSVKVDLGPLAPQELVATALDEHGNEIARASQLINLPRPTAEFEIALENDTKRVTLRWHHLMNLRPKSAELNVDGTTLPLDATFSASVPRLDPLRPHVFTAEMRFADGFVARSELVVQGLRSDSVGTELTPIVLTRRAECFSADETTIRAAAMEKSTARVIFVQDPFPGEAIRSLAPLNETQQSLGWRYASSLASDTTERIIWPVARNFGDSESIATLFARSVDLPASDGGIQWLLTRGYAERSRLNDPQRYADAVAVAGVEAMSGGYRRAVVLVLSGRKDASLHSASEVRHYLASIGVPFFVWSLSGDRAEQAAAWGELEDISTPSKLHAATKRLRAAIEQQWVVWLATDPLTALRARAAESCESQPTR